MNIPLKSIPLLRSSKCLLGLPSGKLFIYAINAHSYNTALKDKLFAEALINADVLLPDGTSIVMARRWLKTKECPDERVTGWDLFQYEMLQLNEKGGKCFFMGSSESVLSMIRDRVEVDFQNIDVFTYSPPYKSEFSDEDNMAIIEAINDVKPNLLWIGLTAPKQEKWAYLHRDRLNINCHVGAIGAVFDFYAGTIRRAPILWQELSLEWLYRLIQEPKRMWRRYLLGNILFVWNVTKERFYNK